MLTVVLRSTINEQTEILIEQNKMQIDIIYSFNILLQVRKCHYWKADEKSYIGRTCQLKGPVSFSQF